MKLTPWCFAAALVALLLGCDTNADGSGSGDRTCGYSYATTHTDDDGQTSTRTYDKDWSCPASAPACLRRHSPPVVVDDALVDGDYGCTALTTVDLRCATTEEDPDKVRACSCSPCSASQVCAIYDADSIWAYVVCIDR